VFVLLPFMLAWWLARAIIRQIRRTL